MANGDMQIQLTGSKLPMLAILGGIFSLIFTIVYATIWLTKLDDRVLDNAMRTAENRVLMQKHAKVIEGIQSNCTKQTHILSTLVERVERMDK